MLTQLSVKNHTLVDTLDIEFESGLSAITGETGAGKSILLNALGLTLGDRADFDQVRAGAKRAEIHAHFDVSALPSAQIFLQEQCLDDEHDCILRRVINVNGSSKAWINGQSVTLTILRELAEVLISIHSQHEHQSLLQAEYQQELINEYAGCKSLADSVAESHQEWKKQQSKLDELKANMQQYMERKDLLEFQLEALSSLSIAEGEYDELTDEQKQLANAEQIQRTLYEASMLLSDDESFNVLQSLRRTESLTQSIDIKNVDLDDANQMLSESFTQLEEVRDSLKRVSSDIQINPERLSEIDSRLSTAFELARKHRCEPSYLPTLAEEIESELSELGDLDDGLGTLESSVSQTKESYMLLATKLSNARSKAAKQLSKDVQTHFNDLNMSGAELKINLKEIEPSNKGLEQCELLIRTNPGQDHKPLARIASGGELSRVSLAIQVVTAGTSHSPTLIFDEVDVGIGGATATVVGEKLRTLGKNAQVICVTHLAQVAAHANHHFSVEKITENGETHTEIKPIDERNRNYEIARMLSGDTDSEHSLKHAEELLKSATV